MKGNFHKAISNEDYKDTYIANMNDLTRQIDNQYFILINLYGKLSKKRIVDTTYSLANVYNFLGILPDDEYTLREIATLVDARDIHSYKSLDGLELHNVERLKILREDYYKNFLGCDKAPEFSQDGVSDIEEGMEDDSASNVIYLYQ